MKQYLEETLYKDWGQFFTDYEILHEEKTDEQDLLLINTQSYGRVLLLDGVVQVTEKDNFVYHELLTHVPITAHGACKRVLVIGGGDGGMIKEVLKYPDVEVTMVEIDESVVKFSKQHLPKISDGAFDNERLNLVIADGCTLVTEKQNEYDVIIVDSTDPIGPGEVLFTKEFYADCKSALTEGGILATQNGVPFTQPEELQQSVAYFKELFAEGTCYLGSVPTYVGGPMAFGFATDNTEALTLSLNTVRERFNSHNIETKYYTPETHKAAFALPRYIEKLV